VTAVAALVAVFMGLSADPATAARAAAAPAARAAAAPAVPSLPPPPVCANAVSPADGTVTASPDPLPVPASVVGGDRLSAPGLQLDLAADTPRPPALRATAWLVADLDAGTVIVSCNAHVALAPASTLKILTSLALAHRLNWDTRYVGQQSDAVTDGSRVGIVPGSGYTVRDLFHGLMLASGNDAATALATLSGGMPATATLMNTEARRLGALDTRAVNDSGLDAPGQVSSVYDLALFGRAALDDPLISRLVGTKTYLFPGRNARQRETFQIQNHNRLLFEYPGSTGVKNGYTSVAGGSYVGSASRNGHHYLVAVLRAEGSTWQLARQLLDWAFAAGPRATPVGRLVGPGEVAATASATTVAALSGSGPAGTRTPSAQGASTSGEATRATASSGAGTAEDTRTGWIVLGTLGTLLLGGISLAGERGRRTTTGCRTRTPSAGRRKPRTGRLSSGRRRPRTGR
jgi:D-alanyl-D-alanine carboxypeptidase (penicillin-binding protein 5/6)